MSSDPMLESLNALDQPLPDETAAIARSNAIHRAANALRRQPPDVASAIILLRDHITQQERAWLEPPEARTEPPGPRSLGEGIMPDRPSLGESVAGILGTFAGRDHGTRSRIHSLHCYACPDRPEIAEIRPSDGLDELVLAALAHHRAVHRR